MQPTTELEQTTRGHCAHAVERSPTEMQELVTFVRLELYNRALPCGPGALRRRLRDHYELTGVPSERTIARILARNELTHGRTGWYDDEGPRRSPVAAAVEQPGRR